MTGRKAYSSSLRSGGVPLVCVELVRQRVIWYMTRALNEAWEIDAHNYLVDVDGEPGIDLRVAVKVPQEWSHLEHAIVTALPAVSAVFEVRAAPHGILGLRGAGIVAAPAGIWQRGPGRR